MSRPGHEPGTYSVTAKVEVPRESAVQVTNVIEIPAGGDCGIVSGERDYALES